MRRQSSRANPNTYFPELLYRANAKIQSHPRWNLHRRTIANASRHRDREASQQMVRMGSSQAAESSLISKQAANLSESATPSSNSFWHASNLHSQRSNSTFALIEHHQQERQHQQRRQRQRDHMEDDQHDEGLIRRSSSLPTDSSMQQLVPFVPPESPPSLVPPSDLPSTKEGIGTSTDFTPSTHLPLRHFVAAAASSAASAAAPRGGSEPDGSIQRQPSQPSRGTSSEVSMLSSSVPPQQSSTFQLDDTSTDIGGSSFSAPPTQSRHVYRKPPRSHRSLTGSRASSSYLLNNAAAAMHAPDSNAVSRVSSVKSHVNSRHSRTTSRNSRHYNRSHWLTNTKMLQTSSSSVLLWSHGMVPGDLSSPLASSVEGDTFISQRACSGPEQGLSVPGPLRRQFASQYSCSAASAAPTRQQSAWQHPQKPQQQFQPHNSEACSTLTGTRPVAQQQRQQLQPPNSDACSLLTGTRPVTAALSPVGSPQLTNLSHIASNTCDEASAAAAVASATSANVPRNRMHDAQHPGGMYLETVSQRTPPQIFRELALHSTGRNSDTPSPCMAPRDSHTNSMPNSSMMQSPCMAPKHQRPNSIPSHPQRCHDLLESHRSTGTNRNSASVMSRTRHDWETADLTCIEGIHAVSALTSKGADSGLENSSATGNVAPLRSGAAVSSSQNDPKGYEDAESTIRAVSIYQSSKRESESTMITGLSIYQSSQIPSEIYATTNFSAFEAGNPQEQLSVFGGGDEGGSTSGQTPFAAMSRESTLRSKSSTSRMGVSREQLAWEYFGSVSDGGVAMPTIMTPGGILKSPVDSGTPGDRSGVESSPEGVGPGVHSDVPHQFGMSSNLGTEISNLMQQVRRMQSRAEKGFSNTLQSSPEFTGFSVGSHCSPRSQGSAVSMSSGTTGTVRVAATGLSRGSDAGRVGRSGDAKRVGSTAGVPSLESDALVASDSVELNFMHGMALWDQEDINELE